MSDSRMIAYDALQARVAGIFAGLGLAADHAARVAECLIEADMRGVATHGISRIPIYARRLREGLVNPRPTLALETPTPVMARLDGDNGMGFVVGTAAMAAAIERAQTYGVGLVFARHSNHFGMATAYLLQAVDAGLAAMVLTNASRTMPVWGGKTPFLGTSPLGMAAPAGAEPPLLLDMATSVAARGKIRRAMQRGEPIPEGWALDEHGKPTTDAAAAYRGVVLPLGGPKGSGLSLMMEAMAGVMAGAAFGGGVRDQYSDFSAPQNVGHLFLAFRPDLFLPDGQYRADMDDLVRRAKACPRADGFDEILMPGERESRRAAEQRRQGVIVAQADLDMLAAEEARG
ncbi:lactate dehydrogenase [Aliidongia dinghuensis]|uniref:Lactate dehydrogenase n=1 Tax=Aliidongia dinghuensis TaxID=1867774 RepID=A0A8J3E6A8_9PROT|nr:Ldh family oxidoreductase [Aliidongia dinghuensis]GGF39735.1 lactate dehydrogenase [Aliidongia dinghuensis]